MEKKGFTFPSRQWLNKYGAADAAHNSALKGILAGGIAGAIEITITYPAEFVKTQLQFSQKGTQKFDGAIHCVRKTIQKRGFFGLYRGMSILLYSSIPKTATRFGAFESYRKLAADSNGKISKSMLLLCGLATGVTEAILVVTPKETIKVKLINDQLSPNPKFHGLLHCIREILRTEGIKGIYQGTTSTILRQSVNVSTRFYVMETLKKNYRGENQSDQTSHISPLVTAAFGAVAGTASVLGSAPLDVVKTRMQALDAKMYKNTWDCFIRIWKEEGLKGYYKGTGPRLLRASVETSITFVMYDVLMELMEEF